MPEKSASMETISCKKAIRCTLPSCSCECFSPSKNSLRLCETCKHGWVAHAIHPEAYALDKLGYRHIFNVGLQVEIVQPNIVFDIASLMLYGAQATPIRLKILLDRLFSVLQHEEVLQVLHGFGWSYEDYARGYILQYDDDTPEPGPAHIQDTSGRVLDKWTCATREEEYVIIQQFLRFGETKSIAQEIILQDTRERQDLYIKQTSRNESEIKKFIERSNMSMQNLIRPFDIRNLFGARLPYVGVTGNRMVSPPVPPPFSTSQTTSTPRELRPPLISVSSTSPITTSPLGRLQTMQPFDFRHETTSPAALSPGEKVPVPTIREISPKSESPQNLCLNSMSASAHSSPPHTPFTPQKMPEAETPVSIVPPTVSLSAASMILPTLQRRSDEGVINFSVKEDQSEMSSSLFVDRKNKHMRKNTNPIKRNWIPDVNFGSPFIGPNGKKRVLCTACNKTFCDKGALKIHYSAVHLKEMHKCSVEGCTMMFSSRRSRNRHSANPNPKLHMPQKRPKVPEGATCIDDGISQKRLLSSPPTMLMGSAMVNRSPLNLMESPDQRSFYADPNIQLPIFPSAAKRLKLDDSDDDDDGPKDLSLPIMRNEYKMHRKDNTMNMSLPIIEYGKDAHSDTEMMNAQNMSLPLIKYERDSQSDTEMVVNDNQDGTASDSEKTEASNNSPGPHRAPSRRKNIPTRCAQPSDRFGMNETEATDLSASAVNVVSNGTHDANDISNRASTNNQIVKADTEAKFIDDDNDEEFSIDKGDHKLVIDDDDDDVGDDEDEDDDDIDRRDTGEVLDFSINALDASEMENLAESGQNSNASSGSNDSSDVGKNNSDAVSDSDIPIDKENPKQCVTCGKSFLNIFGLKIHYRNVHLRLMHNCTVEGCNAAFPSKRSRDRHSYNVNLHCKLLSTAEDQKQDKADDNQNFRADIIQKLYECQNSNDGRESENNAKNDIDNTEKANSENGNCDIEESADKVEIKQTNGVDETKDLEEKLNEKTVSCHICNIELRSSGDLKEHFDLAHPKESLRGSESVYSTRKARSRSNNQSDNLHKNSASESRPITA